ncbi:hypothetical protein HANVADRAFT_47020 [Hanseniaspora valbyensis NRRL Y-1626]|uniref:Uncharacterized protein n=1 Tax=Hanseniaspora valbyensis NRRL Y-1626 TaxID=766949 RepID=A0A1B7TJC1_9ASCO|nr:hypothetical protein HANVADRAFT_47020 [Hanseniaspora valbyensis NRRL Y-1626]
MGPRTRKVVLRKTPLTYEQHYSLLYKYPRKSIINEYYIKNKYLHRIRLSSDIDGLNRLRDRTRRINYFEDSLANRTVNSDSDNNLIYRSRNTFKNRKPKGNKGSRSRTASPKKKKRKIMGDGTANNSSNNTPRFQRHQNRLFLD